MDRFIVVLNVSIIFNTSSLKSNMDRFIANKKYILNIPKYNLKSNMDRFIVSTVALNAAVTLEFKIQYG
mgnify:CR=1 FL=1